MQQVTTRFLRRALLAVWSFWWDLQADESKCNKNKNWCGKYEKDPPWDSQKFGVTQNMREITFKNSSKNSRITSSGVSSGEYCGHVRKISASHHWEIQTHFGMPRGAKIEFSPHWTETCSSSFKFKHYLQASCTKSAKICYNINSVHMLKIKKQEWKERSYHWTQEGFASSLSAVPTEISQKQPLDLLRWWECTTRTAKTCIPIKPISWQPSIPQFLDACCLHQQFFSAWAEAGLPNHPVSPSVMITSWRFTGRDCLGVCSHSAVAIRIYFKFGDKRVWNVVTEWKVCKDSKLSNSLQCWGHLKFVHHLKLHRNLNLVKALHDVPPRTESLKMMPNFCWEENLPPSPCITSPLAPLGFVNRKLLIYNFFVTKRGPRGTSDMKFSRIFSWTFTLASMQR